MRKFIFLLLILISPFPAFSQLDFYPPSRQRIDSLKKKLPGSVSEKRIDILNDLANCLAPINFDSTILYSSQAARLAEFYGYAKGTGVARYNKGNAFFFRQDFKNALLSYLSAKSILENSSYHKELGDLFFMLGNINFFIIRDEKAVSCYHKALYYYRAGHLEASRMKVFDALSLLYFRSGSTDSLSFYGSRLLDYARKIQDRPLESYALMDLALGSDPEKSVGYLMQALKIVKDYKDDRQTGIIYKMLGNCYHTGLFFTENINLRRARSFYEQSEQFLVKSGTTYAYALILQNMSLIDIEEGKYRQAGIKLEKCKANLEAFFRFPEKNKYPFGFYAFGRVFEYYLALSGFKGMYDAWHYLAMSEGNTKEAIQYADLYLQARDTLNAVQQGRQLEMLMAEDEADRQARKIQALAQENELTRLRLSRSRFIFIGTGTVVILASIILLLIFQRRRLRAEQRSVSMEQRLLRAQMNPHFIFNSLASIQNFVINENSDQASIYLSRFSQLVRNILDNSVEEYIPLEKEISTIENYLELQKVRYAGKFDYTIKVDEKIDQDGTLIPPMLAQPFIENAIEHGIRHKETQGHISISFYRYDGLLRYEVEDDGVGREKAYEIESARETRHRSMATSLTRDRLNALNKKLKKKIRMEITDLKDAYGQGCGTRVEFGIPMVER
jgi:tetratricopeptide (TPR) repeat protein